MAVRVADEPEASRFTARADGRLVGFAAYALSGGTLTFTQTEVEPESQGQGIAGELARAGLDSARDRGLRVRPLCSYIAAYVEKHPDYADLVADPR